VTVAFVKRQNVTAKQERFIAEYLVDFNGRQAAIRAGYSKKGAAQHAARLLTSIPIRSAIESRRQTALEAIGLTTERVLKEVTDIALAEISEPVKTSEKLKALEMAGKHLGTFRDRLEHSGPDGAPIQADNLSMARWIAFRFEVARLELETRPDDASSS
jgi:phage terminase small subunit